MLFFVACATLVADDLELRFLDVGQGDAAIVRNQGKTALIDTGPDDRIADRLRALGVQEVNLLVISHNHIDHMGGADAVLATIPVRFFLDNGVPAKTKTQEVLLRLVEARDVRYLHAEARDIGFGDAMLHIIPPVLEAGGDSQNNMSVGVVVQRGRFKALLSGDSEVELISSWLDRGVIPDVDVLKAAHHGSHNGVTPRWMNTTRPEVVVISCGAGNSYGHPHSDALQQYEGGGRVVLRTDRVGDVMVHVAPDGAYRVETQRGGEVTLPGSAAPPATTTTPAPAAGSSTTSAPQPPTPPPATSPAASTGAVVPAAPAAAPAATPTNCCRVCKRGRACGDVCLPRSHQCDRPPGCACNAE